MQLEDYKGQVPERPIVLLMAGGGLGWCVANYLNRVFGGIVIIQEDPEPKQMVIRRRVKLLGRPVALGQVAFGIMSRLLEPLSSGRRRRICAELNLIGRPVTGLRLHRVKSVNSEECRELLQGVHPAVVAVYGTRIISMATLSCVAVPFINYHAGINPAYRGQHPAYWARVFGDPDNAGVTIHLVDRGVDTGDVLYQAKVNFAPGDSIRTYQWVQLGDALPLFERAIRDAVDGGLSPYRVALPSAQHFPPTLWAYAWYGVTRGVW